MHAEHSAKYLAREKRVLMQTLLTRRTQLAHHIEMDQAATVQARQSLENTNEELVNFTQLTQDLESQAEAFTAAALARKAQEKVYLEQHAGRLRTLEDLDREYKREAHAHNCSLSALDQAKLELVRLMRTIDSYHDNLKTQELLDAEHENRKLHAVIHNEKESLSKAKAKVANKGKESEAQIAVLAEKVATLNQQIMHTEQKLQTQMMRIPDFAQLRQALDRLLAQSRKQRDEVLQRMYLLEEIRDKNRVIDMVEIQESHDRQAQLKGIMPLEREIRAESQLPKMLAICKQHQAEIEDLLTEPGFWDREIGAGGN
jgi:chromosome segregation ATPase